MPHVPALPCSCTQIDLGNDGLIPLETRFLHNPTKPHGFVGAALSYSIIHIGLVGECLYF